MRKIVPILIALAAAATIADCGRTGPVLHVYAWADYFKPDIIRRFETARSCRVVIDTFDSNEVLYAKLKAGAFGYDLLTPSSYMVSLMHAQGMLQPLDHALLPNLAHVDPEYLRIAIDKEMDHSVPYMVVNTGLAYLKSRVADFVPSWSMLDRVDLRGRITLLNDMRETIGAGLKSLGYSLNSTDPAELERARDVVLRWKKNIAKFENEQYKMGIASGEFLMVHSYSGDVLQVRRENPDVAFAIPREGTAISVDDLVIPRSAREVGLAHAFIDFLHDPAVAAENSAFLSYVCPNRDGYALLPADMRNDPAVFMSPELRAKSEVFADLGEANVLYVRIWDEIKSAK
jgi:spermidine/putrescine transport system substrate-binding protein